MPRKPRPLKVYGAAIMLRPGEREQLGLAKHISQGRGVVAATSKTQAMRLLGVLWDYVGETGNAADIAVAMEHPGKVVVGGHLDYRPDSPKVVRG